MACFKLCHYTLKLKIIMNFFFHETIFFPNSKPKFPSLLIGDFESWTNEYLALLDIPSSCVFIQTLVPNLIQKEN